MFGRVRGQRARRSRGVRWGVALRGLLLVVPVLLYGCASSAPTGGAGQPDDSDNYQPPDETITREIEEADIVKLEDGYFYLANRWTGLRIIDARAIERPVLAGRAAMQGRAVELFVRDAHAFVLSSADFFYCAGEPIGFNDNASPYAAPDYEGSRISVVDVSDKQAPSVVAQFDLDGFVTATRRVGDVIYAAGNYPEGYVLPPEEDDTDTNGDVDTNGDISTNGDVSTNGDENVNVNVNDNADDGLDGSGGRPQAFVVSINIADPTHPVLVDREIFFGDSFEINVSTQDAMFVAGPDPSMANTTLVSYVDISDPAGDIRLRDQFRVPGVIRNQYYMDLYNGVFRIVAEEFYGIYPTVWAAALYNYDVTNPDDVQRIARLPLADNQGVRSVRFDGPRAYAATSTVSDPLFVLDLADPYAPTIAGDLEILGISTHLVPLGDRLLNVGVDASHTLNPSLTLFDVSNPHAPQPLSRIVIGENGNSVTSQANFDEQAIKVLLDQQLILIPFAYRAENGLDWIDGVQLVDLFATRMAERGAVTHRGLVRRSGVADTRLWILSDEAFKVVQIDSRDEPRELAALDLISEQELLDSGLWGCVDSARFQDQGYDNYYPPYDYWYGGGLACGAGIPAAAAMFGLAFIGLRAISRRRWGGV